ncbi:protein kinase [Bosea sp. LjRoot9]|uniref:serine/threonine protein kinase n=1 Tax=Bosea sp. LjRoot9 TaxID=3342341 RepID=UPI003ECC55E7
MTILQSAWVEVANWKARWEIVEEIKAGGQGEAFQVRRIGDHHPGFLKVIKSRKDLERRARFSREANAYDTIRIDGVPRLIESNAHRHGDLTVIPFIVTEFVEGNTLTEWRAKQTQVSFEVAVALTRRLVDILDACHGEGVVHRDVKPDNIILQADDTTQPWLLDFGLNHHDMPEIDFRTEDWQEVGNRFLRLPELSAGSRLKQDPRSDVSFAAGILFYLLTAEHPDVLQDAEGRLPHQRSGPLARLQAVAGAQHSRLAAIFDHSFAPHIEDRFSSANALRDRLDRLTARLPATTSTDDDLQAITEILDTPAERRRGQAQTAIQEGLRAVDGVFRKINQRVGTALTLAQTNFTVIGGSGKNTLIWRRSGAQDSLLSITYEIQAVGDELVLRMSGEDVYRTSLAAPLWADTFTGEVNRRVVSNLRDVLNNSHALPPEMHRFVEQRPFATLQEAAAEAARTGRNILAFVYDPAQPARGQLDYALGAFLRNRKTRDRMDGAFVTALVPLAQFAEASNILNDASMETSRWVVLDGALHALEEAVIYANAEEAERIMDDLVTRHGGST